MKGNYRSYIALLLILFIWSSDFILGRYLNQYLPPIWSTTLRFTCAVLGLLVLLLVRRELIIPERKLLVRLFLLGVCGIGIFNPMGYIALQYTTSLNSVLINSLSPIATAVLCFLMLKEPLSRKQAVYFLFSIGGVAMIALKGNIFQFIALNAGDMMVLMNVVLWAMYNVFGKGIMQKITPLQATFYTCLGGLIFMTPFGLYQRSQAVIAQVPMGVYCGIAYMGFLGSCLGMYIWYRAVHEIGAVRASMLYNIIPVFTAIQAVLIYHEPLQFYHLVGGGLIIISSIMVLKLSNT